MHSRRKSGSNHESRNGCREREGRKRKEKKESASLSRMRRVRPTSQVRFSPFVERTAAATGPACYYLIFIHSAHCFWITGCPPLHSSSLIFTSGRPASRDLLRYRNTFRKTSYSLLCSASKGGFHCNFHFYIMGYALRQRRDARRHIHSFIFFFVFRPNVKTMAYLILVWTIWRYVVWLIKIK